VIALIVNSEGFPFSYETFDGNRADVAAMETVPFAKFISEPFSGRHDVAKSR
jgi:hypothetical protein